MATPKKTPPAKALAAATNQRSAAAWRSKMNVGIEVEVPSGNVCLVRRPGPEMFMRAGAVPDALTPIVSAAVRSKQGLPPEKIAEMGNDLELLGPMMSMIDQAVVSIMIEPPVHPDPTCDRIMTTESNPDAGWACDKSAGDKIHNDKSEKDFHVMIPGDALPEDQRGPDDFLYVSEVAYADKVFLFQFAVGGSADLERFRAEYTELLGGVSTGADAGGSS